MKLGLTIGYSGAKMQIDIPLIQEAERLGYDTVWSAEAYGSDAVVPLAWCGAHTKKIKLGTGIMQIGARSPASTAMTAMTLDQLSGGRMVLGLGMSNPQVIEGWHGQPYGKPIRRTREYLAILRRIFARQRPLEFEGEYYHIPYRGPDASGLGKPLKSILHCRPDIPIYIAGIGPNNVALSAEVADGLMPVFLSPEKAQVFHDQLERGFARNEKQDDEQQADKKRRERFDLAPYVHVALGNDVAACQDRVRPQLALYIGGMGAKGRNFYNNLARRYGYEETAERVQNLYLSGKKAEAEAALPAALIDEVTLCGPRERVADRLSRYREARVTTLTVGGGNRETLRTMAELVL